VKFGLKVQIKALKNVEAVLNGVNLHAGAIAEGTLEDSIHFSNGSELPFDELRRKVDLVVRQGVRLALIGVLIGALAARSTAHSLTRLLYGVQATDLATYLSVATVFIVVALLACILPARRATSIDPAATIRAS